VTAAGPVDESFAIYYRLENREDDRFTSVFPGGRMRALYGRPEARRYINI